MPNGLLNLTLGLAMQVGSPGPSETPNFQPPPHAYGQYGFEGSSEQRYPFDTQMNWVHGYHQEIPAYGSHPVFRPYNYKDVLSQSQVAGGWGERPSMPYSQQFWHKYQDQATMLKASRTQGNNPPFMMSQQMLPNSQMLPNTQMFPNTQGVYAQPVGLQGQPVIWSQFGTPAQNAIAIPSNMPENFQGPLTTPTSDFNQLNYRK